MSMQATALSAAHCQNVGVLHNSVKNLGTSNICDTINNDKLDQLLEAVMLIEAEQ